MSNSEAPEPPARPPKPSRHQLRAQRTHEAARRTWARLGLDPDRPVTPIAPPPEGTKVVEQTQLPHADVWTRILYRESTNQYLYEVIEPPLEPPERDLYAFLYDSLIQTLEPVTGPGADAPTRLAQAIDAAVKRFRVVFDPSARARVLYHLTRDLLGFGAIDPLLHDPMVEDVSCDGPKIPLYVFHRKYESLRTNLVFADETALDLFVIQLAQKSGKSISIADPLLDATLPDSSRLQATLAREVTTRGSSFTIRRFRDDPYTPPDLITLGTIDAKLGAYLWLAMEAGNNAIFAGGTASGKTTSLNATCLFIPPQKKIVSIEETREINLAHENWIASATRAGFTGEAAGAIDMYRLLEAALRQRPEYILVGEVRGPETFTLFQAMSTGHAVYSTMHADSVQAAVHRLENEPINVPRVMVQQIDLLVIQASVRVGGRLARRVMEVVEVDGIDPLTGDLLTNTVFRWNPATDAFEFLGFSHLLGKLARARNVAVQDIAREWERRARVLSWLEETKRRSIADVTRAITTYYHTPELIDAEIVQEERARSDLLVRLT